MELYADSGGTKTDWVIRDGDVRVAKVRLQGINPSVMAYDEVLSLLTDARNILGTQSGLGTIKDCITSVCFYGSGCRSDRIPTMVHYFKELYPNASTIEVDSDIKGAAKALCGNNRGIACILGTGSNSCLWSGSCIEQATPCLGYILGDEGGGAVMGKLFLNALYKGRLGVQLKDEFESHFSLNINDIINRIYKQPRANFFLASLCLFIREKIEDNHALEQLVTDNFKSFFINNVKPYNSPSLPVNFVGSIAFHFENWLRIAAVEEGFVVGKILKSPLD